MNPIVSIRIRAELSLYVAIFVSALCAPAAFAQSADAGATYVVQPVSRPFDIEDDRDRVVANDTRDDGHKNDIPGELGSPCDAATALRVSDILAWDNGVADGVNGRRPTDNWDPFGLMDDFSLTAGNSTFSAMRVEMIDGTFPLGTPDTTHQAMRLRIYEVPPGGMGGLVHDEDVPIFDRTYIRASGAMTVTDSGQDMFGRDLLYIDVAGVFENLGPDDYAAFVTFPGSGPVDSFWASSHPPIIGEIPRIFGPGRNAAADGSIAFAFRLTLNADCNANGIPDDCDVLQGTAEDCNENDVLDECEPDEDCNGNGVLDECDIADETSGDCYRNGIPDECELGLDCNDNIVPDECEILPWHVDTKLLGVDDALGHYFGRSASLSRNVAVIGAFWDDDNGYHSGSAYVFRGNGATWVQEQKLLADDGAAHDVFARSASVSGDVAVIGAPGDDANGLYSGSAYVFRSDGTTWVQEQKLAPDDGGVSDNFGYAVAVSGDLAVIGAYRDDDNGSDSGSAYVFRWNGENWVQEQKLLPDDDTADAEFGRSVSVSGDVTVIGAALEVDNGSNSGSAYVFRWNGEFWVLEQKFLPDDAADYDSFGAAVSVSVNVIVIGAPGDDENGANSGSAYVFRWDGETWEPEDWLLPDENAAGDNFGRAVSVSGDVALVSARSYGADGSAYLFRWDGATWVRDQKLLPDVDSDEYRFGRSVSVSGDRAVISAYLDDNNGTNSGTAYVFSFSESDCNDNERLDECDIADGTSQDANGNGIPDECEP